MFLTDTDQSTQAHPLLRTATTDVALQPGEWYVKWWLDPETQQIHIETNPKFTIDEAAEQFLAVVRALLNKTEDL
jgi:hypothetical protein